MAGELMSEFEKERKEHPTFTDDEIRQIVRDHEKLKAAGTEETPSSWVLRVHEKARYDRTRAPQMIAPGVARCEGRIRGSDRWELESFIFDKKVFKGPGAAKQWLEKHLKSQISILTDFNAWNERRRRAMNAYLEISEVR
jgi:hypothetical protein